MDAGKAVTLATQTGKLPVERRGGFSKKLSGILEPYLYVSPALVLIIAVMLMPLILGLSYAFRDIRILNPFSGGFVGMAHFQTLMSDQAFLGALANTAWWTFGSLVFQFGLGLILALLLNRAFLGRGLIQALVFLPWACLLYTSPSPRDS